MPATTRRTIAAAFPLVVALVGGCSVAPGGVPDQPTYEGDVRPILESHCVRCHGKPLLGDPGSDLLPEAVAKAYRADPPLPLDFLQHAPGVRARFDRYADTDCPNGYDDDPDCYYGAATFAPFIAMYLSDNPSGPTLPMPPPPAPPLTRHQIDIITRWAAVSPPPER